MTNQGFGVTTRLPGAADDDDDEEDGAGALKLPPFPPPLLFRPLWSKDWDCEGGWKLDVAGDEDKEAVDVQEEVE